MQIDFEQKRRWQREHNDDDDEDDQYDDIREPQKLTKKSGNETVLHEFAERMFATFRSDQKLLGMIAANDTFRVASYLCSEKYAKMLDEIRRLMKQQMSLARSKHGKNLQRTIKAIAAAEQSMIENRIEDAVERYGEAIRCVPHDLPLSDEFHLVKLYSKRSNALKLIGNYRAAQFDLKVMLRYATGSNQCSRDEAMRAPVSMREKIMINDECNQSENNYQEQKFPTVKFESRVSFNPKQISLWFDNRAKGRRHPSGAHFPCAKMAIRANNEILRENPLVVLAASGDRSLCAGCNHLIEGTQFLSCENCDEGMFCSEECFDANRDKHRSLTCGLLEYFRENFSPLSTILVMLYGQLQMCPEYVAKSDIMKRESLATDSDFGGRENRGKLPKRSYQYRYYLLANKQTGKSVGGRGARGSTGGGGTAETTEDNSYKLVSVEAMLALREAADDKDEQLPIIESSLMLDEILIESLFVMLALDCSAGIVASRQKSTQFDKHRLVAIIKDYRRLYRLNSGQALSDAFFVQPIMGTFFWPGCEPNVEASYCADTGILSYITKKDVAKHEKLLVAFPRDYVTKDCRCLACVAPKSEKKKSEEIVGRGNLTNIWSQHYNESNRPGGW